MAKVTQTSITADLTVQLELNEDEARALSAIFGYNVDQFLEVFYERMGKAYVKPHETGVRSLHSTIRGVLEPALCKIGKAKQALRDASLN